MQRQLSAAEVMALRQALQEKAPTSLRLQPEKVTAPLFADAKAIPWHPQGYFLAERPSFVSDPHFHAGAYYVQEAASMLLYEALDWSQDMQILDLCAAPGGKSSLIASAMSAGSYLVSNEIMPQRASILKETMQRWGNARVTVSNSSAEKLAASGAIFDVIVVDAPCSGEGMFRKDAFAREQWSLELVSHCALRQKELLRAILPCLNAGGILLYSTCTYAPAEDEAIVEWLLEDSALKPLALPDFSRYGATAIPVQGVSCAYRCYPHKFRGEGFFIATLQKSHDAMRKEAPAQRQKVQREKNSKISQEFLARYLPPAYTENYHIINHEKQLFLRAHHAPALQGVKILQEGLELAKGFGRNTSRGSSRNASKGVRAGLNPSHGLAMSPAVQAERIALDKEQALRYLSRLELDISTTAKGWLLASYQGSNLGWLKASGGRLNNYYPIPWRIRKSFTELTI